MTHDQVHALAERETQCEKCEIDLFITDAAYKACTENSKPSMSVEKALTIELGIVTVSFGLGVLFHASKCLGLCR